MGIKLYPEHRFLDCTSRTVILKTETNMTKVRNSSQLISGELNLTHDVLTKNLYMRKIGTEWIPKNHIACVRVYC